MLVAALIAAPYLLNSYALSFLMIILITVVGALGLNILTGYTGLISLGHVGFLVTGAYAYAVLVSKYGLPPLVGFLGAGIVPALASLVVGAPSLRLKGLYLAITTLAFSFIINTVILEARTAHQRRPRHFGAAAGDLRRQFRQRRRLYPSLPRLRDPHAVRHAQHPAQPRRPRLCRDPR